MKNIGIICPTFNEEQNILELYKRIIDAISPLENNYKFSFLFIDNCSSDQTVILIKQLIAVDPRVRLIVNNRNFGHIRSPYWGIVNAGGDATIYLASDLQDPPEHISQFIHEWERGWKVVLATKPKSSTNYFTHQLRRNYYKFLDWISEVEIVKDATGFGLYDAQVIAELNKINDPYPYLRGLVCELGFPIKKVEFEQPARARGISKNNFYTLYDIALLGIVSHSVLPLRFASMIGFIMAIFSFFAGIVYLILKLISWNDFSVGLAPLVVGVFFLLGVILIFIGLLGEYVASIHTYVKKRPIVVEKERVNFD
jgi:dolichol-phosphate mannosyltransferase